jgi:hypothetical protein
MLLKEREKRDEKKKKKGRCHQLVVNLKEKAV